MKLKGVSMLEFDSGDTDDYIVDQEENGMYMHSWEFNANVNGEEHTCRHYIAYTEGQGIIESHIIDIEDGKVLAGMTTEIREKIKELEEAAKTNVEYFISSIKQ